MSENKNKKLTPGTYYSCSHQELNENKCSTCANNREKREREEKAKQDPNLIDRDPIMTNTTALPCQGNCGGGFNLVEIHSEGNSDERKYIIKRDCYQQDKTHYICAKCYEKEASQIKSNQIKSNQIKSNQIKSNPIKSNPIKSNQIQSNSVEQDTNKPKNYLPWILGGVGVLGIFGIVVYFVLKNK